MMPATSDDATFLLHAYLDGELDPANTLALEKRIERASEQIDKLNKTIF